MTKLYRLIIGFAGVLFVLFTGSYFIYQYLQKKDHLPEHIQKNRIIEENPEDLGFKVYDLNHKPILLSSLKNKVVLINFWATWCAPCVEELPSLNALAGYEPENVVILAVSNERTDDIKNFLIAFPKFYDNFIPANVGRKEMMKFFSVTAFPETYIFNKGQMVEKIIGPQKWDSDKWKKRVTSLIE